MASRVPDSLMYAKGQDSLNRARDKMIRNQEKGLTGKRVNRPSDDPVAAMQIMQTTILQSRDATVAENLEVANGFLNMTDASLGELTDVLARAHELSIQMSSSTNATEDARESVRKEVDQLLLRVVQVGNSRFGDRYIFGGFQTDRAPFDTSGNYFGDDGQFEIEMDRGQKIAINVLGMEPFFGVAQITQNAQTARKNPLQDSDPSIRGDIREPASIVAANKGIDPVEDPEAFESLKRKAGVNIFQVISDFSKGLETGERGLLNRAVEDLDRGYQQVLASRAVVGARQNILKMSLDSLEANKVNLAEVKSSAEDADTLQVYSDLAKNENVLKASLEVNRKLLQPSLLDFLK